MIDRDILLVVIGGLIGAFSSLSTLIAIYLLEGMRLRRKWRREDQLALRQNQQELEKLLSKVGQPQESEEPPAP